MGRCEILHHLGRLDEWKPQKNGKTGINQDEPPINSNSFNHSTRLGFNFLMVSIPWTFAGLHWGDGSLSSLLHTVTLKLIAGFVKLWDFLMSDTVDGGNPAPVSRWAVYPIAIPIAVTNCLVQDFATKKNVFPVEWD